MPKTYKKTNINGEQVGVCRLLKNERCVIGQTVDGRFVVYTMKDKQFHLFNIEDGKSLNSFLIENALIGVILYKGKRGDYNITLLYLPDRGYSLKWSDADDTYIENYYDSEDERMDLVDSLIGVFNFSPNNPADAKVLEHMGYYYQEYL